MSKKMQKKEDPSEEGQAGGFSFDVSRTRVSNAMKLVTVIGRQKSEGASVRRLRFVILFRD
jgi:hypothetical protein